MPHKKTLPLPGCVCRDANCTIPFGLCHCGCEGKTEICKSSVARRGWVRGQPRPFVHGHHRRKTGELYKVEDRGYKTSCWIWLHAKSGEGYAETSKDYKTLLVHRLKYEAKYGPLSDDKELDHLCRQRACINPDHLELVPHKVNMQRGINAKITQKDADEIRELAGFGMTHESIAARFPLCRSRVSMIIRGEAWKID